MRTQLYWAHIRTYSSIGNGRQQSNGYMQVHVRAQNPFYAKQQLIAQYGAENVLSEAIYVPGSEEGGW